MLDLKVHQAPPVHLDLLGQVVKKEKRERGVLLVRRESEEAEDYQDPPGAVGPPGKTTQHATSYSSGRQLG